MGSIKEYLFRDWAEFKSLFAERLQQHTDKPDSPLERGRFLFRGMEDSEWHLETSFSRKFGRPSLHGKPEDLLENLRSAYKPDKELEKIINKDHEIAALGQHYGSTSQLLDWSESPYIAAYFAFRFALVNLAKTTGSEIRSEQKNIAIWALNSEDKKLWTKEKENPGDPGPRKILIVRAHPAYNERLHRQLGWFTTLSGIVEPLDEHVLKLEYEKIVLWKFLVPLREVVHAMSDLSLMGIDSAQMYGGYEGMAMGALDKTIIGCLIRDSRSVGK